MGKSAVELKDEGNAAFKECKFQRAVDLYTQSIDIDSTVAPVFCNRAFAHLKMEAFGAAITDANKSIELDPTFIKGYYRRASACLALGKHGDALKDFKKVYTIAPNDVDAKAKYTQCDKEVRRMRFLAAIENPEDPLVSDTLDPAAMEVPSSYEGPHLPATGITRDFVVDMMAHMKEQKTIHKKYVLQMLLSFREVLRKLPNVLDVQVPAGKEITVCGDIHGQYYDLLHLFQINGLPSEDNPYHFNGDFVDRGSFSFECVICLIGWKLLYPDHLHMLRGNHEGRNLNKVYGFEGEVKAKYDEKVFAVFSEVFDWLPLASVIDKTVFVTHGGLFSKDGVTIADINKVNRNCDIPEAGLMCEMLWSDPSPVPGRMPNKRGVGVAFGEDVTTRFLADNGLKLMIRSHEVKDEGYEVDHSGKLITVFTAPNYCDQIGNKAAFIRLKGGEMTPRFTQFTASPHPTVRPMQYSCFPGMQ